MGESSIAQVSRRSTRLFEEEDGIIIGEDKSREKQRSSRGSSVNGEPRSIPMADLDLDSSSLRATLEDMGNKTETKPLNFGTVVDGKIYRSSFPCTDDFQFLQTLGLKTVVSLVNKEWDPEFKSFMGSNGIHHEIIEMHGTKKVDISPEIMQKIMDVVLNQENYPLLIHCNHGKHRTGCAVAVIRLLHGWTVPRVIDEYRGHAQPKVRDCDLKYIREYQVSSLRPGLITTNSPRPDAASVVSSRMRLNFIGAAAILLIWLTSVATFRQS